LQLALSELVSDARSGRHANVCDVQFGERVVRLLSEAERQIESSSDGRRR
jgi:hypothetical protein